MTYKGFKSKQAYDKYQRELMRIRQGTKHPRDIEKVDGRMCPVCDTLKPLTEYFYHGHYWTTCHDCGNQIQNEKRWVAKNEKTTDKMRSTLSISIDDAINYFSINNVGQKYSKDSLIMDISVLLTHYLTIMLYDRNHSKHEALIETIRKTYNDITLSNIKIVDGLTGLTLFKGIKFKEEIITKNRQTWKPHINDPLFDEYDHKTLVYSKEEAAYEQHFVDDVGIVCDSCGTDNWEKLIPYIMFNKKTGERYFATPNRGVFPKIEHQDHPDWKTICRKCFNNFNWYSIIKKVNNRCRHCGGIFESDNERCVCFNGFCEE